MAEEKKDDKKDAKKPSSGIGSEDVFLLVLGLITIFFVTIPRLAPSPQGTGTQVLNIDTGEMITTNPEQRGYSLGQIYNRVFNVGENNNPSLVEEARFRLTDLFKNMFYGVIIIAIFLSLLFWILKSYFAFKLKIIAEKYNESIGFKEDDLTKVDKIPADYVPDTNGLRNPKWEMIETYARSGNQAELRLAIIEADIMMFDILNQSGFPGNTLGEILKNTNKSQLATLDYAWSAHKVRNELAHQGSGYVLGRAEAEAALDGYRRVFTELNLI